MTTLRVVRLEALTPAPRLRVHRLEAQASTATARLRAHRLEVSAVASTTARARVHRLEVVVLPPVTVPSSLAVRTFDTVQMQATVPVGVTVGGWQWEQLSGTTVTLNGSTGLRTFTAPGRDHGAGVVVPGPRPDRRLILPVVHGDRECRPPPHRLVATRRCPVAWCPRALAGHQHHRH